METPKIYPARDGVCPRCGAENQQGNTFCSACSLRLAAGLWGLDGRSALASASWMQANPEQAERWRAFLATQETERPRPEPGLPSEDDLRREREKDAAMAELTSRALEARVLAQVANEALLKLAASRERCRAAGVPEDEISRHVALDRVPGLQTITAPSDSAAAASGGGFAFFYAEAGIDGDGDGDVDGGLIDTLTGGDDNGEDGPLGWLGDVFG